MVVRTEAVREWCKEHDQGRCFGGWSDPEIDGYLAQMQELGSLVVAVDPERGIEGVACGWPCTIEEVRAPGFAARPRPGPGRGKEVWLAADVIAARPGVAGRMLREWARRMPWWRKFRVMAVRKGRVVEYPRRVVERWLAGESPA